MNMTDSIALPSATRLVIIKVVNKDLCEFLFNDQL